MPVAKESGGTFTPVPEGTHIARCVDVISLGTQPSNNPEYEPHFKVLIGWEIADEFIERDGEKVPMKISKEYTLSLSDKANLRRDLESWRGKKFTGDELKGFHVEKLLGAPCLLGVTHAERNGKTYANVSSVAKLLKGMEAPKQVHPSTHYEIEDGRSNVFSELPEWVQKKIAQCFEWKNSPAQHDEHEKEIEPEEEEETPF